MKFPFTNQLGARDCGPACLKMVAAYYGQEYALGFLRDKCHITKVGVSLLGISEAAEIIGFQSTGVKADIEQLKAIVQDIPAILHWSEHHFVVVYKSPPPGKVGKFYVADPATGLLTFREAELMERWVGNHPDKNFEAGFSLNGNSNQPVGYALLLEPTAAFYDAPKIEGLKKKIDLSSNWKYFTPHKKIFLKLLAGMLISSGIMVVTPFLTQAMVDRGINLRDINFIYLVLFGQLLLFFGSSIADIVRSSLLLHMGTRINISMVSDFLAKILKLPISFFESHITGDLMQRMNDHHRVENLLTVSSLNTVFSILNFAVLSVVLAVYSMPIFLLFMVGSFLGFCWMLLFLKKRKKNDYQFFELYSKESNKVIEIMTGMQDIKISNSMHQKRWEWEKIQGTLYKLKIKSLSIAQFQNIGSAIFKQGTSILITFLAAKAVMSGDLTLGTMFAITMIVGQLSSPLEQLHSLVTTWQDAKLGMERINDVMVQKEEDAEEHEVLNHIPSQEDIILKNVSFGYGSEKAEPVLKNISLTIPAGKVTAIVGASGSGKTTLLKLLLRFYDPGKGTIYLGKHTYQKLHHGMWRDKCGVVMQEGQLFSGTIADNIAMGQEKNYNAIVKAAGIADIAELINTLPMQYSTEIGAEGIAVSAGQKQRVLLARAVYKNPSYLFLDEATSSLDANTERTVIENLNQYFEGKTVVVIAHRLSTVKYADQLIVLDNGKIVETGSHVDLTRKKGMYYKLVKNQLELGE
jgi:ATP-binding cassette subfamily B protein